VVVLEDNKMIFLAENAVKAALKRGAHEAEAYVYEGQATNVGIELGQISKTSRIIDRGLGIRVVFSKATGFAYTNITDDSQTVEKVAEKALSSARASKPDPEWRELPQKKEYSSTKRTFDQRIVDLDSEVIVGIASTMLDAAGGVDKRVFPIDGGVGCGYVSNAIANSNGVSGFDKGTIVECSIAALAKEGRSVTPVCFEFNVSREYNLDPEWVGREAAKLAVSAIKTKSIETRSAKVIFTQFALQELLGYTLVNAIKVDSVQRDQSPFGKIGKKSRLKTSAFMMMSYLMVDCVLQFLTARFPIRRRQ
jgi:PmbA protein